MNASTLDYLAVELPEVQCPTQRWRSTGNSDEDDEAREGITVDHFAIFDASTNPGELLTARVIRKLNERLQLVGLIAQFASEGLSWNPHSEGKISRDTTVAAVRFLALLDDAYKMPRIAPDGEGGLMLVWEGQGDPVVGVIDGWRLHVVAGAGTPHAHYIDGVLFDGSDIPDSVLRRIPLS